MIDRKEKAGVLPVQIKRFSKGLISGQPDLLAMEEPLEIRIRNKGSESDVEIPFLVTMRTPGNDFELVAGLLFSERIIKSYSEIISIRYCENPRTDEEKNNIIIVMLAPEERSITTVPRNVFMNSSCGVCGKASIEDLKLGLPLPELNASYKISAELVATLPSKLLEAQVNFRNTGGIHACGLFDLDGNLQFSREDIGRHNALDKLIGAALQSGIVPVSELILVLSGRASFELLQKAATARIFLVIAIGAPSSLALQVAEAFNITLIGFTKDQSFNVYSGFGRIALP